MALTRQTRGNVTTVATDAEPFSALIIHDGRVARRLNGCRTVTSIHEIFAGTPDECDAEAARLADADATLTLEVEELANG